MRATAPFALAMLATRPLDCVTLTREQEMSESWPPAIAHAVLRGNVSRPKKRNLSMLRKTTVAFLLLSPFCAASAAERLSAEELRFVQSQAPGVVTWTKTASGLYESADAQGPRVKVYAGVGGAALYLSRLRDRLFEAKHKSMSPDSNIAKAALSNAIALKAHLEALDPSAKPHQASALEKGTLNHYDMAVTCGPNYYGDAWFTASNEGMVDYPVVTLEQTIGPGFGPECESFQIQYRWAGASIDDLVEISSTGSLSAPLYVEARSVTFPGSCSMGTEHGARYRSGNGPWQIVGVEYQTTCADVAGR